LIASISISTDVIQRINSMTTTLITGSASGIGAATRQALMATGHHVIGVDLRQADIVGDLSTAEGRQAVIAQALVRCHGKLDGLVLCAGLGGQTQPASLVTSVNYFGAVELTARAPKRQPSSGRGHFLGGIGHAALGQKPLGCSLRGP
jgi:NAD(P)-dependent dehydrogenase (short-subunit alcohol dehydrogenase family)